MHSSGQPALPFATEQELSMARQREPMSQVVAALRRAIGLHGDAVGNAARSVRDNDRARRHRTRVEQEISALDGIGPARDPNSDPLA